VHVSPVVLIWWREEDSNLRSRPTTDLQSVPFGHSGIPPDEDYAKIDVWSWRWDSNPQPADYKSAALPVELRQHIQIVDDSTLCSKKCEVFCINDFALHVKIFCKIPRKKLYHNARTRHNRQIVGSILSHINRVIHLFIPLFEYLNNNRAASSLLQI
jgi:hypothetical protein